MDWASYAGAASGVTVSLALAVQNRGSGDAAGDRLIAIENLRGSIAGDSLTGDANDNVIDGGLSADDIQGGGGSDTLIGGYGDDIVSGGLGADALQGDDGNDQLSGDDGADTLYGGQGIDLLTGGAGADRFVWGLSVESTLAAADQVADFTRGEDILDLSGLDADRLTDGDQAFALVDDFTGVAGELVFAAQGGNGVLLADANGDLEVDFAIALIGVTQLGAADLVL